MHSFAHHHNHASEAQPDQTHGWIMNWGWRYDLLVWVMDIPLRGQVKKLRRKAIDLAQIQSGEAVLDVGCGTGSLALEAYARVGTTGRVCGIDPGPQQLARARAKAAHHNVPINFQLGVIEKLAFPDQTFDAVLSTLMMHHLPDDLKRAGLTEIARVLKPGGRLAVIDFKHQEDHAGQPARIGAGEIDIQDLPALLQETGFSHIEAGDIQFPHIPGLSGPGFVRAQKS